MKKSKNSTRLITASTDCKFNSTVKIKFTETNDYKFSVSYKVKGTSGTKIENAIKSHNKETV